MKTKPANGDNADRTIISHGVKVEGKVTSSGSVRIDGIILGDIDSQGNVTIGELGEVTGKVNGQSITIGGKVQGSINSKEKLILESKADLKGDVYTKILVVEAGARFDGKSNMGASGNTSSSNQQTTS